MWNAPLHYHENRLNYWEFAEKCTMNTSLSPREILILCCHINKKKSCRDRKRHLELCQNSLAFCTCLNPPRVLVFLTSAHFTFCFDFFICNSNLFLSLRQERSWDLVAESYSSLLLIRDSRSRFLLCKRVESRECQINASLALSRARHVTDLRVIETTN